MRILKEFQEFVNRGNVVDLAVDRDYRYRISEHRQQLGERFDHAAHRIGGRMGQVG